MCDQGLEVRVGLSRFHQLQRFQLLPRMILQSLFLSLRHVKIHLCGFAQAMQKSQDI